MPSILELSFQGTHAPRVQKWIMTRLLKRPVFLLTGIVPLLVLGFISYRQVGSGFMPVMDEGGFILDYRTPPGTALSETDRLLRQVEDIITATPEVLTYSRRTGTQLGGGLTEANEGDFFIRLKPLPRRPIEDVMDDIRKKVEREVPGIDIELAQLMEDLIGDLTAVPQPIRDQTVLRQPIPACRRGPASGRCHRWNTRRGGCTQRHRSCGGRAGHPDGPN